MEVVNQQAFFPYMITWDQAVTRYRKMQCWVCIQSFIIQTLTSRSKNIQ